MDNNESLDQFFEEYRKSHRQKHMSSKKLLEHLQSSDNHKHYFFNKPQAGNIEVPIFETANEDQTVFTPSSGVISLNPQLYGFPNNIDIGINPPADVETIEGVGVFSPLGNWLRDNILNFGKQDKVNLSYLLDTITKHVNNSFAFDFKSTIAMYERRGVPTEELIAAQQEHTNPSNMQEVNCAHAGMYIRRVLDALHLPRTIYYQCVPTTREPGFRHDTTLVLETQTGLWSVLNAKSPMIPHTVIPFEELDNLGFPYNQRH